MRNFKANYLAMQLLACLNFALKILIIITVNIIVIIHI